MDITAPFMLRSDVLLVPVADLDEQVRGSIDCEDEDVALTRPRSRTPSTVVEATAARLLEHFREPRTLVEALVLYGRKEGRDPDALLEDAYQLLVRLLQSGFVVPATGEADIEDAEEGPVLEPGAKLDGGTVVRPIYVLEDTDLYLARAPDGRYLALKLQRPSSRVGALFRREAEVLRRLEGGVAPRLEREGELDGLAYLLMEWCPGLDGEAASMEHRGEADERAGLLGVVRAIARAYAELHGRGVLHGDVHPRNLLISAEGAARLIDFGFASMPGAPDPAPGFARGGIPFFYEPEFARAGLEGAPPPPPTEAGEQFAVAAMLYQLVVGAYYQDFSMGREAMLREVVERPPIPFAERGREPWPDLEAVLFRALSKEPAERYPSMAAFARALDAVAQPSPRPAGTSEPSPLADAIDALLAEVGFEGERLAAEPERGPTASVNYGAAGVASALLRIAAAREDPRLLALADAWCARAEALAERDDAFENAEVDLTADTIGTAAPLHARSGVAAVRAAVARALGDDAMQRAATEAFAEASGSGHKGYDLAIGRAGTILAAALMLDALPSSVPRDGILHTGREHLEALWSWLDGLGEIAESEVGNLGVAHGWAGFFYATLQWHRASADPLPAALPDGLEQLARLAEPSTSTRGLAWPWSLREAEGPSTSMPGWCNGTAGHAALWCLAHEILGEPRHLELAVGAAWDVWDAPDVAGTLCCGLVGRAYALLRVHRATNDDLWLRRARRLGERAAAFGQFEDDFPLSLYKGRLALAMLAADLERPEGAAHPFFEQERWPGRAPASSRVTLGPRSPERVDTPRSDGSQR